MKAINKIIEIYPYTFVMLLALILRLIAAIFSQGYGMHDDHFLVIEASQSWVDGFDYNSWLPWNQIDPKPEGHSFFYVGIHYLILSVFKFLGVNSPVIKMLIIRILHALFSLITVSLSYKITEKLSNRKTAFQVGMLMAALWFMPFFSVRNLVEIVSIPFLLAGIFLIVKLEYDFKMKNQSQRQYNVVLIAGLIMGIAFSVRYQTLLFIGGTGIVFMIQKKWREMLIFGIGAFISIGVLQSITDYFIWGYPFAEFIEYVRYNIDNRYSYLTGDWYMYILTLLGFFLFPLGLFLLFGYFRVWRKHLLIFLPSFIFLAFHSYFPNKQERFIFTIMPFVIILGIIGWNEWIEKSGVWQKISKYGMILFWISNVLLLGFGITAYSKKARIEAMKYMSKYEVSDFLVECTGNGKIVQMPQFYMGQWANEYIMKSTKNLNPEIYKITISEDTLKKIYINEAILALKNVNVQQNSKQYNKSQDFQSIDFVIFISEDNLQMRVDLMKTIFPELKFEYKAKHGLIDIVIQYLNPVNKNQDILVYKTRN